MNEIELTLPNISDGEDKSSALKNRIRKNYRHTRKWAKRTGSDCFRIYDREIHGYPLSIDFYAGRFCVHYFCKKGSDQAPPDSLVKEIEEILSAIFDVGSESIYWRTRIKRAKNEQYEKAGASKEFFTVHEYGLSFRINLLDYLDTGLFLDHRETRQIVRSLSAGKRVLNLLAYTCSFSVYAAAGGASFTKSVDMSNTYTAWGRENFILNEKAAKLQCGAKSTLSLSDKASFSTPSNHFSGMSNEIVREDCLKFLDEEIASRKKYDIIIIDPPTISRSKKMTGMFDVQVDHVPLILKSLRLLSKGGIIFFSTNFRKFVFDKELVQSLHVEEISYKTVPKDFHDQKIHRCWKISATS